MRTEPAVAEGVVMPTTEELLAIIDLQVEVAELGLDLSGVMDLVVRRVLDLAHAEGAAIELAEGSVMVYRAVAGRALTQLGLRVDAARSLSGLCWPRAPGWCARTRKPTPVSTGRLPRGGPALDDRRAAVHHGRCVGVLKAFSAARPFRRRRGGAVAAVPRGGHHHVLGHPLRRERPVPPRHP
jgi:hypothetical protein